MNGMTSKGRMVAKGYVALIVLGLVLAAAPAYAQEGASGPGRMEMTVIPGGGTFFLDTDNEPGFGNYDLGATIGYNFNRFVGIDRQVGQQEPFDRRLPSRWTLLEDVDDIDHQRRQRLLRRVGRPTQLDGGRGEAQASDAVTSRRVPLPLRALDVRPR